jgi:hypothetical protein
MSVSYGNARILTDACRDVGVRAVKCAVRDQQPVEASQLAQNRFAAFEFMARDLAGRARELRTVAGVRAAVAAGLFSGGFVSRALREPEA